MPVDPNVLIGLATTTAKGLVTDSVNLFSAVWGYILVVFVSFWVLGLILKVLRVFRV